MFEGRTDIFKHEGRNMCEIFWVLVLRRNWWRHRFFCQDFWYNGIDTSIFQCLKMLLFCCPCNPFVVWTWNQRCFYTFKCVLQLFICLVKQLRSSSNRLRNNIGWSWELMELNWISESQLQSTISVSCIPVIFLTFLSI